MGVNAIEFALLAGWVVGVGAALYAVHDDDMPLRRYGIPLLAAFVPIVGSVIGITLALLRLWLKRSVDTKSTPV